MNACPHCGRPLAGEICVLHGFVGKKKDEDFGRVPIGGIIMYSGSATLVPSGWQLCDGTFGTPDLRDKFVIGAGNTYAVAATGGSNANHGHTISTSTSTTVTIAAGGPTSHSVNTDYVTYAAGAAEVFPVNSVENHSTHGHPGSTATSTSTSTATAASSMPAYYALALIMRVR